MTLLDQVQKRQARAILFNVLLDIGLFIGALLVIKWLFFSLR